MNKLIDSQNNIAILEFSKCIGVGRGTALRWLWSNRDLFHARPENNGYNANIPELIKRAKNLQDHLSIMRLFRRRKAQGIRGDIKHLRLVCDFLEKTEWGIKKISIDNLHNKDKVTFILNDILRSGVHSRVIILHILSIASHKKIKTVNIIYLNEANIPNNDSRIIEAKLKSSLLSFLQKTPESCLDNNQEDVISKINIVVPTTSENFQNNLSGIVFRFQGGSPLLSHHIFLREIFKNRFVATITFSSRVKDSKFTDIILSRNKKDLEEKEVPYPFPNTYRPIQKINKTAFLQRRNIITSVYGGERIHRFFGNANKQDIEYIENILTDSNVEKWVLVGASDVNSAYASAMKVLSEHSYRKISIIGRADLKTLYREAKIFLALPGIFGGGGGASEAVANGVPIITHIDKDSDISNSFTDDAQFSDTEQALIFLSNGLVSQNIIYNLLCKQQGEMEEKFNLKASGERIYEILEKSVKSGKFDHKFRAAENT
ncbi:hypothetical protein [Halomonas huangheensis]|uniref:Glycosyl transferase family 1 domain-containing protein n=1 Tax=Halomonas huangheensis TaxID=1178482 RepID=W1NA28_9GAMM|nr:hypothetical protein [Halomonas huangheensis]ALM53718.1 hypothetical protein AR456_16630 [Halomonas huangheensis]ERL52369.1 hypothetical protein BJB45_10405 [Halomonas huangheensis]